jgi:integrase
MGTLLWREGGRRLVIQWVDAAGATKQQTIRSKALDGSPLSRRSLERDGRHRLAELELEVSRQRSGLSPISSDVLRRPLAWLLDWWWLHRGATLKSPAIRGFIEKHLAELLELPLAQVSPVVVERRLHELAEELSPKSRKHLRGYLFSIFELARKAGGPWHGRANPIEDVAPVEVPRRPRAILRPEEMPAVLDKLPADSRGWHATALYAGLREGEIFGLLKSDVDLEVGVLMVSRSWDAPRTKDGKALPVTFAEPLRPYLKLALQSPGALLFPDQVGEMQPRSLRLGKQLRRALVAAELLDGHEWRCRAWKCGWRERHPSKVPPAECPKCHRPTTWSKPLPRPVRFHDTRHSFGTALVRAAGLAVAQKGLRHSDVRLTADTYGHLEVEDQRTGVDAAFGTRNAAGVLQKPGRSGKKKARVR